MISKANCANILGGETMENERELRLSIEELQAILIKAKLVKANEAVYEARIEPGELVIKVVK